MHGKSTTCPHLPHPDHDVVWQEAIDGLAVWFDLSHTNPEIWECICLTLHLCSIDACFAPFTSPTIMAAALDQDAIGWMNFIEGRISLEWHMAQSHFYASIGLSRTSCQWAKELVQNLLCTAPEERALTFGGLQNNNKDGG